VSRRLVSPCNSAQMTVREGRWHGNDYLWQRVFYRLV